MKLQIPQSLISSTPTSACPRKVQLLRSPSSASELRVLPAHPLAPDFGWIATPKQQPKGGRFRILVAGDSQVIVEGLPGVLAESYDDQDGKRYRRAELDQATYVPSKPVLVIGAGSIASTFLALLVRQGHRSVIVVDPDRVEHSNATKSILYNESYTGVFKVDALPHALGCAEPGVDVLGFPNRWDADFINAHGDEILEREPSLVYFSADDVAPLYELVAWLDAARTQGKAVPHVLVQLVFINARAGFVLHWDPRDPSMPCPGCFFAKNPQIFDRRNAGEEISPLIYAPTRLAASSSPQIACDIAYHVSLGVSYAAALLSGSIERLAIVGEKPWLYSVALRHPSPDTADFLDPRQAGHVFLFPGYDGKPDPGCSCCRVAGRLGDMPPADMEA